MEKEQIIDTIKSVFNGADERNWPKIQKAISNEICIDYTSMNGGEPLILNPNQLTDMWKSFIPGFDKTNHKLTDFNVDLKGINTVVTFKGYADHYIDNEIWTVIGDYESLIEKTNEGWKISKLKFNISSQKGNDSLPNKALLIVQNKINY